MADLGTMNVRVGADVSTLKREMDSGGKSVREFSTKSTASIKEVSTSLTSFDSIIENVTAKLNRDLDARVFKALEASSAQLEHQLADLSKEAITTSSSFSRLSANLTPTSKILADTAMKSSRLDSTLARGKGINAATFALTDLGRVAQDLPYGFIGIQNNLNPLLESFQRLKTETGSTGGALKALLGSLKGAGGVGLALSVVTAAVTFATMGFDMWTRGMHSNKKALDENAKSAKEAADSYKSIVDSVAKESARVDVLVQQLKTEVLTRKERNAAIEELKRISPQYFANLNTEKATIEQITASYNKYTASIIKSIEAKVREKKLEDVTSRILDLQDKGRKTTEEQVDANGKLIKSNIGRMQSEEDLIESLKNGETAYERFQAKVEGVSGLSLKEQRELNELIKTRAILVQELANGPKDSNIKEDKKTNSKANSKAKKDVETIADILTKLEIQINFLNQKEIVLKTSQAKEKINAIEGAINTLMQKFKLLANNKVILNLEAQINDIQLTEQFKKVLKGEGDVSKIVMPLDLLYEINDKHEIIFPQGTDEKLLREDIIKKLKSLGINKTFKVDLGFGVLMSEGLDTASMAKILATMDEVNKRLLQGAQITNDLLSPAFDALFTSILTGSQNAFQAFGQALQQTMVQLAATILRAAALSAILAAITPGGSFGSIFKKMLGFSDGGLVKGFATGGYISGPGTKTSDSIFARLSRGEYVIKASTVDKFGVGFFDKLNRGMMPKYDSFGFAKFAQGGFVSPSIIRASQVPSLSGIAIGPGQSIQIHGNFELRNDRLVAAVSRGNARISRNS